MVVHDGAVPKTVIRIRTSTVIMAFVSQFLKWNCTVEKETVYQMFVLLVYTFLREKHNPNSNAQKSTSTEFSICCFFCCSTTWSAARLNWSSIQGSVPWENWNVTLYPFTLRGFRETKYCPPLFFCISLLCVPLPYCLSVFFPLLLQMCVCIFHYISAIISHPAGSSPCLRRSYSRAS